jgi:hypothetical protein
MMKRDILFALFLVPCERERKNASELLLLLLLHLWWVC